tara:strand:- start:680 stop:922 length:243 start_codon:yes stop_codon:yes gene_type:complete
MNKSVQLWIIGISGALLQRQACRYRLKNILRSKHRQENTNVNVYGFGSKGSVRFAGTAYYKILTLRSSEPTPCHIVTLTC